MPQARRVLGWPNACERWRGGPQACERTRIVDGA